MPNYARAAANIGTGALAGGATGAAIGSAVPVIGTAIGAGGGAIIGALTKLLEHAANKPPKHQRQAIKQALETLKQQQGQQGNRVPTEPNVTGNPLTGYTFGDYGRQLPIYSPAQESVLYELLRRGLAGSSPEAIEKRARTQFEQRTVPTLAERFTSMGAGAQSSPAFAQTLGQAGANLEEGLAALRSQYALSQLGLGLSPLFETFYIPGSQTEGILKQGASALMNPETARGWVELIKSIYSGYKQPGATESQDTTPAPFQLPPQSPQVQAYQAAGLIPSQSRPQGAMPQLPNPTPAPTLTNTPESQAVQRMRMVQGAYNPNLLSQRLM